MHVRSHKRYNPGQRRKPKAAGEPVVERRGVFYINGLQSPSTLCRVVACVVSALLTPPALWFHHPHLSRDKGTYFLALFADKGLHGVITQLAMAEEDGHPEAEAGEAQYVFEENVSTEIFVFPPALPLDLCLIMYNIILGRKYTLALASTPVMGFWFCVWCV